MLRNKAMMPMFRLPFIFSSLLDFGHNGYVIMTIHPLIMHFFSFFDEFCTICMFVCLACCNASLLVVVKIGHLEIFDSVGSKTLSALYEIES